MSEYQYYEFQAIDRPLTSKEMNELRAYSSRARITPSSFVNDYSWGSFKGDEDAWMAKYFDAFLYLANWGTHILKLRLPGSLLDGTTARKYLQGDSAFVREKSGKVILSFTSQDEEGSDWIEGEGELSSMISVRSELARGDLRALYLGWLLLVQEECLEDDEAEPPVPPGLGQLSASLESLAEFLRIDEDLLHVAAKASQPFGEIEFRHNEVRDWVGRLAVTEKDDFITDLMMDSNSVRIAELQRKFAQQQSQSGTDAASSGRTVGQLLRMAEARTEVRRKLEAEQHAREKAQHECEAAAAREKHLDNLAGREPKLWAEIERLVATKQPLNYDRAVTILLDLKDLAARAAGSDFSLRLAKIHEAHAKKSIFIKRLTKKGII
jgi:hypothetical protein